MIAEGAAAFGSLKVAIDLAKGVQSLQTSTAVNQAISEILNALVDARSDALDAVQTEAALLKRIDNLEAEVARLKAWEGGKDRYKLKRFRPGVLAYEFQHALHPEEPPHCLCAACFDRTQKGRLQATAELDSGMRVHRCDSCGQTTPLGPEMGTTPEPTPARREPVDTLRKRDVFNRGGR